MHPTPRTSTKVIGYKPPALTHPKYGKVITEHPETKNILRYQPGQAIVFEGDVINYLYEILTGTVKTYTLLNDGRRSITGFYTTGDIIGLPAESNYFYTVETITQSTVCCHSVTKIKKLINSNSEFSQKIIKTAFNQLHDAHEQIVSLGRKKPDERVATFLLSCQKWTNVQIPLSTIVVTLPMSRLDIADYLGLTQETVCRVFSKFRRGGLITPLRSDQLIINNNRQLSKLARLCE